MKIRLKTLELLKKKQYYEKENLKQKKVTTIKSTIRIETNNLKF